MATKRVYIDSYNYLEQTINETAVKTAENKSTVKEELKLYLPYGNSYFSASNTKAKVKGGNEVDYGDVYCGKGTYTLASAEYDVQHDEQGELVYNSTGYLHSSIGNWDLSLDITLTKIDRYPALITAPDFNDEENPTITYTTALGFEGATVEAGISDITDTFSYVPYRPVVVEDGTYTFELTNAERNTLRNATPNSNTLDVIFKLRTTTIGNQKYFSTLTKKMTIVNADPTFTYITQETNTKVSSLLGTSGDTVVQNVSTLRVTTTPSAKKQTTITGVKVESQDFTRIVTSSPYVVDIPIKSSSFAITVTDARGNATSNIYTKTMIEYQPVDITNLSMKRINPTSSNIRLNLEARYYQQTFGSTANVPTVKWKLNDGTYTTIPSSAYTIDTTNNKLTISNYIIQDVLEYRQIGQFTLYIEDLLTNDTEGGERGKVLKGIDTFDAGEHDFKVNGDLFVADQDGNNKVNVLTFTGSKIGIEDIKLEEFESSATVSGNAMQEVNMGSASIPTGYTLLGIIPRNNGYGDQWVVSYSLYNDSVYAMIHSK